MTLQVTNNFLTQSSLFLVTGRGMWWIKYATSIIVCGAVLIVLVGFQSYNNWETRRLSTLAGKISVMEMVGSDPSVALFAHTKVRSHHHHSINTSSTTDVVPKNQSFLPEFVDTSSTRIKALNTPRPESLSSSNATKPIHVVSDSNPLFYMYDLDEEFWWRWPVDGSDCSQNGYVGHEHKDYSGIGPLVDPDSGLYLTWHFSLFSSLYNRMKRSSRRTYDPEKASLFIIPYDLGLDGYLDAKSCNTRRTCSNGLVGKLTNILKKSKYFTRHDGADHALLWSLGQYHPWPRAGCDVFMKDFCAKCTITCYWMDATRGESRFVSVPFPSGYHWWDGIKHLPWDLSLAPQRNMTAVYLGSTQTLNPTHTKIRRAMTAQCNTSSECHWLQIAHSSKDTSIVDLLSAYKRATFCLCPPGDDPARKAVFDCIVSGSIPVIFELNTIYNQYPWHLTEQEALDISVYVPGGMVRSGKLDFMSVLLAISPEVIRKKQEVLAVIAPRVQYAMPPPALLLDRYDNTTWDPPFKDGVELTLDGMFTRVDNVLNNRSTHIPPKLLSGREWGREYDMVRVQVPNITEDRLSIQIDQDKKIRQGMKGVTGQQGASSGGHGGGGGGGRGGHGQHNGNNGHGNGHNRKHKAGPANSATGEAGQGKDGTVGNFGNAHPKKRHPTLGAPGDEDFTEPKKSP